MWKSVRKQLFLKSRKGAVSGSFVTDFHRSQLSGLFIFMTHVFLIHDPDRDQYFIKGMGLAQKTFQVVYRDEGMSDGDFYEKAVNQFDKLISDNQFLKRAQIIKEAYIF